jgi:hypothetical protein
VGQGAALQDPLQHGLAADVGQDLAWQPGGFQSGRHRHHEPHQRRSCWAEPIAGHQAEFTKPSSPSHSLAPGPCHQSGHGGGVRGGPFCRLNGSIKIRHPPGLAGGLGAMAFIPFSFYQEYSDTVKALAIDSGEGCNEPTIENLLAGTYTPLGRSLYMFPAASALGREEVVAFYTFVIERNEEIAAAAGLVALTADQKAEQLAAVAALAG